jgi:uncharacterized membrane protein
MQERSIHRLFTITVTLKGLHALLELVTGAVLLVLDPAVISNFIFALARREWTYDSRDLLANFLVRAGLRMLNGGQHFVGIYLLVVGLINLGLVIGLLAGAFWSYPAALGALALLMAYQLFRYTHTHAVALIVLTFFDVIVWWLVWHEYHVIQAGREGKASPRKAVRREAQTHEGEW